jgi:guanylate kinase
MEKAPIDFNVLKQHPLLIVISGPSGVGKDSVVRELMRRNPNLDFAITTTDRQRRANEVEGIDYYFVNTDEFKRMIDAGNFLEHSLVYNQLKGVTRKEIIDKWALGKDVLLRVDFQGAMKFKSMFPETLMIFLLPTSEEELRLRLLDRGTESTETIEMRMATTREEMKSLDVFDYLVYNPHGRMDEAVHILEAILVAEHHRNKPRQISL